MLDVDRLGITVERAVTIPALLDAYALVHDAYVEKGYMLPMAGGTRVRAFEALPEMATFVARIEGRVVAVTSVILDTPKLGLPSDHAFGEELDRLRRQPGRVCEITNLAVAHEYSNTPVFLQLTQACFAHATAKGCGNMFVAISPGHARFFHDILQFDHFGPRRNCSDEVEDVVQGMRLRVSDGESLARDFDAVMGPEDAFLYDFYYSKNLAHRLVATWDILSERVFADPLFLQEMFIVRTELLAHCTADELDAIRHGWGDSTFQVVCADTDLHAAPERSSTGRASAA